MCSKKLSFSEKLADSFYGLKNCQKFQKTDTHHSNNITIMQLSYKKLLLNLALDYNNTLLYHSSTVSKYINKYGSEHLNQMKLKIRKKDERLQQIEDNIVIVLMLQKRKRLVHEEKESVPRKRGKYEKNSLFFTDPKTGERSVMTYKHSMWWQNYIVNPQSEKQWWRELFCV